MAAYTVCMMAAVCHTYIKLENWQEMKMSEVGELTMQKRIIKGRHGLSWFSFYNIHWCGSYGQNNV